MPELTDGRALPAAPRLGAAFWRRHQGWEMLADIGSDGGAGAMEIEALGQLIGQERKVQRLGVGQTGSQEIVGGLRPRSFVIAAGRQEGKAGFVAQPAVPEPIELRWADMDALSGGQSVELAGVEGGEDFLNVQRRNAMSELFLFMWAAK